MITPDQTRQELQAGLEIGWELTGAMRLVSDESTAGWQELENMLGKVSHKAVELAEDNPFVHIARADEHANKANEYTNEARPLAENMATTVTKALVGDDEGAPKPKYSTTENSNEQLSMEITASINGLPQRILDIGTRAVHASGVLQGITGLPEYAQIDGAKSKFTDVLDESVLVIETIGDTAQKVNNYLARLDLEPIAWPPVTTQPGGQANS